MTASDGNDCRQSHRRSESFFGRRKGPQLNKRKRRLLADLLPPLNINVERDRPYDLSILFPASPSRIHLEIGFGGGEHLISQALLHTETGHIGVEPFINGMAKMLGEIEDSNLDNIRLFDDDATMLLDWLPDQSVDRVDLLYPDPWPKKRHWKRRFVNQTNLTRITRVLKSNGVFRFASDIDTYINWTLTHCDNEPNLSWKARRAKEWCEPWPEWVRTRYEAKAIREGRTPNYLTFVRL